MLVLGEDPVAAGLRELKEETGYTGKVVDVSDPIFFSYDLTTSDEIFVTLDGWFAIFIYFRLMRKPRRTKTQNKISEMRNLLKFSQFLSIISNNRSKVVHFFIFLISFFF